MGYGRRADAVFFGFDFQVNAAIVLFLENVKEVKCLKLEGDFEDIELELNNGHYILAQAKAVENASRDFHNVRAKMEKAIITLSEGNQKTNADELIVVTNSPNPFCDEGSRSVFYGHSHRKYDTLPESAKNLVDSYMAGITNPLDTEKFMVQVIPFETDDDNERYKVIMECINNFIGEINPDVPGIAKKLLDVWHWQVFDNGGKHDVTRKLTKEDIVWPILVKIIENTSCDEELLEQFDAGVYEEIRNKYSEIIEEHCERCDFFIKILSAYNEFKFSGKPKEKLNQFICDRWEDFSPEFDTPGIDADVNEAITKIVMYQVIKRRYAIDRVKEGTNL